MVPAKRSLVNFSEGKTTTLIGVLDVSEVIVKVVEGGISTSSLDDGSRSSSHCTEGVLVDDDDDGDELVDRVLSWRRECVTEEQSLSRRGPEGGLILLSRGGRRRASEIALEAEMSMDATFPFGCASGLGVGGIRD